MRPARRSIAALAAIALSIPAAARGQTIDFGAGTVTMTVAEVSPIPTTFVYATDFRLFTYDAFNMLAPFATSVTAPLYDLNALGCTAAEFAGFPAGAIALITRGSCNFDQKYLNAQAAGASGVLFLNAGGFLGNMTGDPDPSGPVFIVSDAVGASLRAQAASRSVIMQLSYSYVPTTVPEPATIVLTGAGLLALGAARVRRRTR